MAFLRDFLTYIPDPDDDNFSRDLTTIAQFALNGSKATEPRPEKGDKYKHQKFAGFYFLLYSDQLIIHEPGTGKSCLASTITETLKREFLRKDDLFYSPPIRKFFVVARGDVLTENWKQELVCTCTNNLYFDEEWRNLAPDQQTRRVNKALADYYLFLTHSDLVNLVSNKTDEEMVEYFSNTGIIVDEAHNLIVESSDTGTKINVKETKQVYDMLWKIFHIASGMKKILMTATPMRNGPQELAKLLNLLNDEDHQIDRDIESYSKEELWGFMKGKVSYLREMTRKINVEYVGKPLNQLIDEPDLNVDTIVYPCPMIGEQQAIYIDTAIEERKKSVYIKTRQAANIVFPDGSYGKQGFDTYIIKKNAKESKGSYNYELSDEFKEYFDDGNTIEEKLELLQNLSSKYYALLTLAHENPNNKAIYYSEYKQGSGAIVGLLIFSYILDYEIVTSKFLSQFAEDNGFCSSSDIDFSIIPKKKRIALLVPEMSNASRKALLNLYNSPENAQGEYIGWVFFTPVGREGLSFNNVTIIARDETWTYATGKQSERRGIRSNSHLEIAEILGGEENVNVRIYRLLPLLSGDEPNILPTRDDKEEIKYRDVVTDKIQVQEDDEEVEIEDDLDGFDDIDVMTSRFSRASLGDPEVYNSPAYAYYRADLRGKRIDKMTRYIKEFDATGYVHRERNLQKDRIYEGYKLYNPSGTPFEPTSELDYAWYRRFPPENVINKITNLLKVHYRYNFSLPIIFIYESIDEPAELIQICLMEMVMRQVTFENRYGNRCFIAISDTNVSLVPQTISSSIEHEYYSVFAFRYIPQKIDDVFENYYLEKKKVELDRYFVSKTVKIDTILPQLPLVARNYLLEKAISLDARKDVPLTLQEAKTVDSIIARYKPRIFDIGQGNGRVKVTTLLSFKQSERMKHTDTSPLRNIDRIRIFDLQTQKWRDPASRTELDFYVSQVQSELQKRVDSLPRIFIVEYYVDQIVKNVVTKVLQRDLVTTIIIDKQVVGPVLVFNEKTKKWISPASDEDSEFYKANIQTGLDRRDDSSPTNEIEIYGFKLIDDDKTLRISNPSTFKNVDKRTHQTGRSFRQAPPDYKSSVYYALAIDLGNVKVWDMTEEEKMKTLDIAKITYSHQDEMDYKVKWVLWKKEKKVEDDTLPVEKKLKEIDRLVYY